MKKILLLLLLMLSAQAHSASLHGDPDCSHWHSLDNTVKHTWLNAILAPLNMTYMSRVKPSEDKFAKLGSMQPVAEWMDRYCASQTGARAIVGAMLFFEELTTQ